MFSLENLDAGVNTGRSNARCIEWMAEIHDCPRCLHHWILLVMFDELAERCKLLATADIVFVVLQNAVTVSVVIEAFSMEFP